MWSCQPVCMGSGSTRPLTVRANASKPRWEHRRNLPVSGTSTEHPLTDLVRYLAEELAERHFRHSLENEQATPLPPSDQD